MNFLEADYSEYFKEGEPIDGAEEQIVDGFTNSEIPEIIANPIPDRT